ncbi:hypothetical protein KBY79_08840 [Synechococcus lacustris C3-12m-Tous]|uniref:hypothetical protein n=1 Tax=Synechococcus lacustris TaxID=2116544 RepID=UPI0020CCFFF7|nr:hypothetical protein [Synechococcus lacustris]MCP9925315.1 hypothetical protein [Synechococcus lacustris C3-12m-Tous]
MKTDKKSQYFKIFIFFAIAIFGFIGTGNDVNCAPLITVESDLQQADNTTGVVTATGNVKVTYPEKKLIATSRQAQYYTKEGRIVLSGDVDVVQEGGNRLRAQRVVYLVTSDRLIADPAAGEQVKSWIRIDRKQANTPAP